MVYQEFLSLPPFILFSLPGTLIKFKWHNVYESNLRLLIFLIILIKNKTREQIFSLAVNQSYKTTITINNNIQF